EIVRVPWGLRCGSRGARGGSLRQLLGILRSLLGILRRGFRLLGYVAHLIAHLLPDLLGRRRRRRGHVHRRNGWRLGRAPLSVLYVRHRCSRNWNRPVSVRKVAPESVARHFKPFPRSGHLNQ